MPELACDGVLFDCDGVLVDSDQLPHVDLRIGDLTELRWTGSGLITG